MIDAVFLTLGELAVIRAGHPFRGAIPEDPDGAVRVVQMKDVDTSGYLDWSGVVRTEIEKKPLESLMVGDVLFASRGTRFYAACVDSVPGPSVCSPHFFHLQLRRPDKVLPRFLTWQINQPPVQQVLQQFAEGSSQLSIRRGVLERLSIALPAIEKQATIVQLAQHAQHEKELLSQLIQNRERQLAAIAAQLASKVSNQKSSVRDHSHE